MLFITLVFNTYFVKGQEKDTIFGSQFSSGAYIASYSPDSSIVGILQNFNGNCFVTLLSNTEKKTIGTVNIPIGDLYMNITVSNDFKFIISRRIDRSSFNSSHLNYYFNSDGIQIKSDTINCFEFKCKFISRDLTLITYTKLNKIEASRYKKHVLILNSVYTKIKEVEIELDKDESLGDPMYTENGIEFQITHWDINLSKYVNDSNKIEKISFH